MAVSSLVVWKSCLLFCHYGALTDSSRPPTLNLLAAVSFCADWQRKALEIQNQARLEVTAARQEALATAQELGSSQKLIARLQQQLDDALGQQQTLRGSLQRLEMSAGKLGTQLNTGRGG